jgi:hypothetical protein
MAEEIEAGPEALTIDRSDLDNLSEKERKETEEILGEVASGGAPKAPVGEKKIEGEVPAKEPELDAEGKPKVVAGEKKDPPEVAKPTPAARREASTVPAFKLKIAEKREEKSQGRVAELEAELAALKKEGDKAIKDGGAPAEVAKDTETRLKAISEKSGIDVEVLKEIVDAVRPASSVTIPPEIATALEEIGKNKAEAAASVEVANYNADFDRLILPLIQKEYGDKEGKVPPETVTKIKDELAKIAYSPEYSKVPYEEIYLGKTDFRGIIPAAAKGAEVSRGGSTAIVEHQNGQGTATAVDWEKLGSDKTYAVDDEVLKGLSNTDLERYFEIIDKRK